MKYFRALEKASMIIPALMKFILKASKQNFTTKKKPKCAG
jgi:hypothetical protein